MNRLFAALLFTATAFAATAQPTINSVIPGSASTAGGEVITITGTGFSTCVNCSPALPPTVFFGGAASPHVEILNENALRVVVPAHLPNTVTIAIYQHNGVATKQNAFLFTGKIEDGFDRVLLPLFTAPVEGAFGSRFITELRLASSSNTHATRLFGLLPVCHLSPCILFDALEQPYEIPVGETETSGDFENTGSPAAFLYIPKSAPRIETNLRVYDESRSASNFGTELPVVYDREFTSDPIRLMGVPLDPRFRNTLRIYSTEETQVLVSFAGVSRPVHLEAGTNLLDPAYAQFSDFGTGTGTIDVTIAHGATPPFPGFENPKVWAFISVTNNDTQLITTITPQR